MPHMIYFLVSHDGQLVKIGSSGRPLKERVRELRAASTFEFYAAICGSKDEEKQLHGHFDRLRYEDREEMFHLKEDLHDYLEWLGTRAYVATSFEEVADCYPFPGRFPWRAEPPLREMNVQQSLDGLDQIVPGLRRPLTRSNRILATIRSDSDEWYTPSIYIEAARRVMGGIDLDPASTALANLTVRADSIYTATEDGLRWGWRGRVWLNPPYANEKDKFVVHLLDDYDNRRVEQAVVCLNAHATDTRWFQPLWQFPICFTHHRVRFIGGMNGTTPDTGAPTTGTAFVYLGPNEGRFADEFRQFGPIVRCAAWPSTTGEEFRRLQAAGTDWER